MSSSTPNPQVIHLWKTRSVIAAQSPCDDIPIEGPALLQESEPKPKTSPEASVKKDNGQVPDRWPYLLDKLGSADDRWDKLSVGGLVKIAKATSVEAVSYALTVASLTQPALHSSAYGWVQATAKTFLEAGVT